MGKKKKGGEEAAVMRKKKRRCKQSVELTDDLITDIISRVHVKDLIRFTCVSKSWCSLIMSADSYLSQLRSQRTALGDHTFLIIQKKEYLLKGDRLYHNYWLELDSIEDGNPKPRQLHNPFHDDDDHPRRDARVIASYEGLLVLRQRPSRKMVVLNPTTKKHHVVPPNPAGDSNVGFVGFGYDHVHGCYKLVTKIKYVSSDNEDEYHGIELMTYDVNNCTWKKSRYEGLDDDCYYLLRHSGVCIEGALYWCKETMTKILCFVLAEEEFHNVDPPYFDDNVESFLTVFDGRLCLVCCKLWPDYRVELWLMECDYKRQLGSSYSPRWIEFLLISDLVAILPRDFTGHDLIPICFSACENKILFSMANSQLFWYDIGKNKFRELKSCTNIFGYGFDALVIVPSIVGIGAS